MPLSKHLSLCKFVLCAIPVLVFGAPELPEMPTTGNITPERSVCLVVGKATMICKLLSRGRELTVVCDEKTCKTYLVRYRT